MASFLFSIIDAILEFLLDILKTIGEEVMKFLAHPIKYVEQKLAILSNTISSWLDIGDFDPNQFEEFRTDPCIYISQAEFESMRENLEKNINREVARIG